MFLAEIRAENETCCMRVSARASDSAFLAFTERCSILMSTKAIRALVATWPLLVISCGGRVRLEIDPAAEPPRYVPEAGVALPAADAGAAPEAGVDVPPTPPAPPIRCGGLLNKLECSGDETCCLNRAVSYCRPRGTRDGC